MKFDIDSPMADVVFLDTHPGWSYRDLLDAPDDIIRALQLLESKRA